MSEETSASVSDDTKVAIPLRNLVSILGAVSISTWAYFGVIERLNAIESKMMQHWEEIEENDNWIDEFQPPKAVRETVERVRELEIRVVILETMLKDKDK